MKKLLVGLLALWSITAFAQNLELQKGETVTVSVPNCKVSQIESAKLDRKNLILTATCEPKTCVAQMKGSRLSGGV
jgi:hypothetical protein